MATRRVAEAAWIESRGYWQIKVQKDGVRKAFTSSKKGRKGKHAAETAADEWLDNGTEEMRFIKGWDLFLADMLSRTSLASYKKHEGIGRLYILPVIGTRKVSAVTTVMWQQCVSEAAKRGISRRYCKNIRDSIMAFLEFCRKSRWTYYPLKAKDITIPNSAAPAKKKVILQPDDIRTLFSEDTYLKNNRPVFAHYIYAWRFLVVTGMRRGELIGLRWEDITDDTITINRSVNEQNQVTYGKNDNARRTFAITQIARRVLQDQRAYMNRLGVISPWVFPDDDGSRTIPRVMYGRWVSYSGQRGFKTSLHELRHTFVSLSKSDMPVELMKAVVGHSSSMDTYGIYGHTVDGDARRAATIVEGVFDKILK